jgi:hypothetical protein
LVSTTLRFNAHALTGAEPADPGVCSHRAVDAEVSKAPANEFNIIKLIK